ncbi:hypothetical protein P692DRAFT_20243899 [Suillus brevipes Sb2]|nr:hypothetical protein P692DRAFT_20243899 [Suillus brevipes Sb2]
MFSQSPSLDLFLKFTAVFGLLARSSIKGEAEGSTRCECLQQDQTLQVRPCPRESDRGKAILLWSGCNH